MFKYTISIDKKVIAILGPHLYGDTASIIAELVANSHDADAEHCWITIKTGSAPEIVIEDNGIGMTPDEVNKYFLDVGYDRREERPITAKKRRVFGRKGIGKLSAFSLAKKIELYSLKDGKRAGCILDYDKITKEGKDPDTIPDNSIRFEKNRLSPNGTGTRLVLKDIQKNVNTTYYHLVNRIVRNFSIEFNKFQIFIAKNNGDPKKIDYTSLNFFDKMDTIVTIGDDHKTKAELVRKNGIPEKYKRVFTYEDDLKKATTGAAGLVQIPRTIDVFTKAGGKVKVAFTFNGWLGTIVDKGELRGLIFTEGASKDEQESISINDNRITIFSRDRVGEYDVLPKVQTEQIYDSYIIGEVYADIFEDDQLVDMAISNRRGYEETDERYRALIDDLKALIRLIVQRKAEVQRIRNADKDIEEANKLKEEFLGKSRTMTILREKLNEGEQKEVQDENLQFMRAAHLAQSTKKILISHDSGNKEYGFFLMRIFELLGLDVNSSVIFTSYEPTGVPHGEKIYDYLKDCFREDMYVVFLFSRDFYDSNVCIAETGAAWATNRVHSNIVIDIDYPDIDKPIDNTKVSLAINDLSKLNVDAALKFVKAVYTHIGPKVPDDKYIKDAIQQAMKEFSGKLAVDGYYPKRRYQARPVCDACGVPMDLKKTKAGLFYECKTPKCKNKNEPKAKIR